MPKGYVIAHAEVTNPEKWAEYVAESKVALDKYAGAIRGKLTKKKGDGDNTLIGDPIGREALLAELSREMIPYTPTELIELAERELAWCDAEMAKATRDLGFDASAPPPRSPSISGWRSFASSRSRVARAQIRGAVERLPRSGLSTAAPSAQPHGGRPR